MRSKREKRKDREICRDFYNRCRGYHRNLSKIKTSRLKYDEVVNNMYGVSSAVMKDVIMENTSDSGHVWDHHLVEKEDELLLERAALLYGTVIVNRALNNIANGEVVDMTTECYTNRNKKHDDIVYNHNRSKPIIYSNMNRAVLSQLKR